MMRAETQHVASEKLGRGLVFPQSVLGEADEACRHGGEQAWQGLTGELTGLVS